MLTNAYLVGIVGAMPRITQRPKLILTEEEEQQLKQLSLSRTAPHREVQRSRILLYYHERRNIKAIAGLTHTTRRIVYKCVDKALEMGWKEALRDLPHGRQDRTITPEDQAWVIHLACTKPKELGYAAELWSRQALAAHVRREAVTAGHPGFAKAAKATIHRILTEAQIQPHKIRYYMERHDPDFEAKMKEVLLVYREISTAPLDGVKSADGRPVFTVSVDEKPGVQALANTAPDLPPAAGTYPTVSRDHEYRRLGTASILAALDLQDGHVVARVERRHRSREFIGLLRDLDATYPAEAIIRVILDNHSSHISKETRAYLATRPNRFSYVHTPKHGSWLNLVETLFGKMARTFLRGIRVETWEELKERIQKGVAEINSAPVAHRWKKFDVAQKLAG